MSLLLLQTLCVMALFKKIYIENIVTATVEVIGIPLVAELIIIKTHSP